MDIKRKLETKLIADDVSLNSIGIFRDKELMLIHQEDSSVNHMHQQHSLSIHKTTATISWLCGIGRRDTKISKTEDRGIDPWDLEIGPDRHMQLIIDEGAQLVEGREKSLFNEWCQSKWTSIGKEMKLDLNPTTSTTITSKQIMGLNVKHETIRRLDKKT